MTYPRKLDIVPWAMGPLVAQIQSLGREDPLEKEMATYSSTIAWKIPWMEEPGRLQSMGSWRVRTRLSDFTFTFHFHALEKKRATHSSIVAWRIPGTEPGGLPSMGSHRVGHNWRDLAAVLVYSIVIQIFIFSFIWLLQGIEYSSLGYTVGPYCLSFLNVIICT